MIDSATPWFDVSLMQPIMVFVGGHIIELSGCFRIFGENTVDGLLLTIEHIIDIGGVCLVCVVGE